MAIDRIRAALVISAAVVASLLAAAGCESGSSSGARGATASANGTVTTASSPAPEQRPERVARRVNPTISEVLREQSNTAFGDMFMVRVGGLIIEVLAPDRPDSSLAQIIERRGEGIDSIGFYVDDIKAATEAMEASGIRFASKDERLAWVHPKNPLSLSIELLNSALVQLDPKTS